MHHSGRNVSECDSRKRLRGVGVFVSAFEAGLGAGQGAAALRAGADVAGFGSRKSNNSIGIIGRAHIANSVRRTEPGRLKSALDGLFALVLPVTLLVSVGGVCAVYSRTPVAEFGTLAGQPMNLGLALLPLTFFVLQLTNRRYGAAYAFAQMILAYILVVTLAVTAGSSSWNPSPTPVDMRVFISFGAGLFAAQLVSVILFDGLRGPTWWKAPLISSLAGGAVLSLVAFPAAYAGTGTDWSGDMVNYLEIASAASVVLLVPYGLLRSIVPPGAGFGGY